MDLNLVDAWWTFQGEGLHAGRRALFVRVPFCNLACEWCDTEFNKYKKWTEREFLDLAGSESGRFAVVTGGEPMLNKQTPRIVSMLHNLGFKVAVESNGTVEPNAPFDFVTISPKRQSADKKMEPYFVHPLAWANADEFKYVVDRYFDFSILDRHTKLDFKRHSLSPEFGDFKANLNKIFDFIQKNPHWRISLQTHKWIGVP